MGKARMVFFENTEGGFPAYVSFRNGSFCMWHCGCGHYFRDAGIWGIYAAGGEGARLVSKRSRGDTSHFGGMGLVGVSGEEEEGKGQQGVFTRWGGV